MDPSSSPTSHVYTVTRSPFAIAQQTDQTLIALASARRLSREYIKVHPGDILSCLDRITVGLQDSSNISSPTRCSYYGGSSQHHQSRRGDPSDSYIRRSPRLGTTSPSTSMGSPKSVEGHACRCCGKVFGRPSALKVGPTLRSLIWNKLKIHSHQIHMAIHTGEKGEIRQCFVATLIVADSFTPRFQSVHLSRSWVSSLL